MWFRLKAGLLPSRAIIGLSVAFVLLLSSVWLLSLRTQHDTELRHAEQTLLRIAKFLKEHAERTFGGALVLAQRTREKALEQGLASLDGDASSQLLDGYAETLPQVSGVALIDRDGRIVAESGSVRPLDRADVAALLEGQAQSAGGTLTRLISRDGDPANLLISRRLDAPDRSLLGIVAVSVNLNYFDEFYRTLDMGGQGRVGLAWSGGGMLVAQPPPDAQHKTAARQAVPPVGSGGIRHYSQVDGVERIAASAAVEAVPVRVFAAFAVEDVLAGFRRQTKERMFIGAGIVAILGVLVWLVWGRAKSEERLRRDVQAALDQRNMLFREIHHRIKNNLQVVNNLIMMHATGIDDQRTQAVLRSLSDRICSMSLIHETLYQHEQPDEVDFPALLKALCRNLAAAYAPDGRVAVSVHGKDGAVPLSQAVPLSLIVTEVVSNAYKHAFPGNRRGRIEVSFRRDAAGGVVEVTDDGVGLDTTAGRAGSIGLNLINALAAQLGGEVKVRSGAGTRFEVRFAG